MSTRQVSVLVLVVMALALCVGFFIGLNSVNRCPSKTYYIEAPSFDDVRVTTTKVPFSDNVVIAKDDLDRIYDKLQETQSELLYQSVSISSSRSSFRVFPVPVSDSLLNTANSKSVSVAAAEAAQAQVNVILRTEAMSRCGTDATDYYDLSK